MRISDWSSDVCSSDRGRNHVVLGLVPFLPLRCPRGSSSHTSLINRPWSTSQGHRARGPEDQHACATSSPASVTSSRTRPGSPRFHEGASMGGTVEVTGLTKSFGRQNIWRDVTMTLPPGEITALLGPSGTGKSVFLKSVMGLIDPEAGSILIDGVDMVTAKESKRLALRKKFGVLFQDGALFGSMNEIGRAHV